MKNRKTRLWFFLLLPILSIAAFFLFRSNSQLQHLPITASQPTQQHKKADNVPSLVRDKTDKLHQSVDPWDVWLNDQVEVQTEAFLIAIEAEMPYELMLVKEQINDIKSQIRAAFEREAEKLKANSAEPPPVRVFDFSEFEPPENHEEIETQKHDGPQTVEALLKSFEDMLVDPEVDEKYPQAEWIQMLLDRGIVIEDFADYSGYLAARANLVYFENTPKIWKDGNAGFPPTEDWETFKAALIDRRIWQYQQIKTAKGSDPELTGGMFIGDDYKTFFPFKPGRVYVSRFEGGGIFHGESLTDKQKFDILYRGIHPDKYDIVYLDENDAVFSEPPSTITREELGITKPSQAEPLLPLASQMPSVHSQEMPPEDVTDLVQKSVEEAQVMRQQEEALPEEKALMEFFEKVTRNEADFEAELERLLTPKLLELPTEERIEAAFHEQFAPQRFQKAVATLQRYGIEEGMRRLRKTDAEIAGHFERVLPSQSRIDSQRKKD